MSSASTIAVTTAAPGLRTAAGSSANREKQKRNEKGKKAKRGKVEKGKRREEHRGERREEHTREKM